MFKIFIIMLMILTVSILQARQNYSERGMKTYKKLCKHCHGGPYKGAAMLRVREWKNLFKEGDAEILALHLKNKKALDVFNSSYYRNRRRQLVKFLVTSGSDLGVVPACDGNYCGH